MKGQTEKIILGLGALGVLAIFFFICPSVHGQTSSTTLYFPAQEKVLDEGGEVVEEKTYLSLPHTMVVKQQDGLFYLHQDHLSSTRLVTDSQGNKLEEDDYYPYGSLVASASATISDKLYTSQTKDDSTSLYYYHARYYNPQTAHFLSADEAQGPNRYLYVAGNPISRNDPTGEQGTYLPMITNQGGVLTGQAAYEALYNIPISEQYARQNWDEDYRRQQFWKHAGMATGSLTVAAGGLIYGPALVPFAYSAMNSAQKFMGNPKMQTVRTGAELVGTAADIACSSGVAGACPIGVLGDVADLAGIVPSVSQENSGRPPRTVISGDVALMKGVSDVDVVGDVGMMKRCVGCTVQGSVGGVIDSSLIAVGGDVPLVKGSSHLAIDGSVGLIKDSSYIGITRDVGLITRGSNYVMVGGDVGMVRSSSNVIVYGTTGLVKHSSGRFFRLR